MMDNEGRKRKRHDESNESGESKADESKAEEAWFRMRQQQVGAQTDSLRLSSAMGQLNRDEFVRSSLQAQGGLNSIPLLSQALPSRGTGMAIPEVTLNSALLPNTASLARSQILRSTLHGNSMWSSAPLNPRSILSVNPSTRNVAVEPPILPANLSASLPASLSTPSLFFGTTNVQNAALRLSLLDQVSAQQRLQQDVIHRPVPPEAFRQAPVPAILQSQVSYATTGDTLVARLPPSRQYNHQSRPNLETLPVGRAPVMLYLPCDDESLTPYQCLARRQIELFEATHADVEAGTQGRNRSIVLGQVGIRCRHCGALKLADRARGSTYYPKKLQGLYQAAQNMTNSHMAQHCKKIPKDIRDELQRLGNKKSSAGAGKDYWSGGAKILGVVEDEHGLRFERSRSFN